MFTVFDDDTGLDDWLVQGGGDVPGAAGCAPGRAGQLGAGDETYGGGAGGEHVEGLLDVFAAHGFVAQG